MMIRLRMLFCPHLRMSIPINVEGYEGRKWTFQVCGDCGKPTVVPHSSIERTE